MKVNAYTLHRWRRDMPYRLARLLPKSWIYWGLIRAGIETIADDEVVPKVRYTEVLQRWGAKL